MIQNIAPSIYHNEYLPKEPRENDFVLGYHDNKIYLHHNQSLIRVKDLPNKDNLYYAFEIDDKAYFIASISTDQFPLFPISILRTLEPKTAAFAGVTGYQLNRWLHANQYCGCCGHKMIHDPFERAERCPNCNAIVYPKISPAVIVAVTNNDEILLTKYAQGYKKYALIAGFNEIGETIEETVIREVKEEVGLQVKNIRYFSSQPWSFSDTLLFGFVCEVEGNTTITLDHNELKEAVWVKREDIIKDYSDASLTHYMMNLFAERKL